VIATAAPLAATASSDADYERLGLARGDIKAWEDGARTDDRPGTYEWWYFDAHLDDGAKLVVVFLDKDLASAQKPLEPTIRLNLDLADGRSFEKLVTFDPALWSSARDHTDVRIGKNRFTGDLHTYRISAMVEDIAVDVTLVGEVPSWRPETGYMLFGEDRKLEFAWLPSVPQGKVTATYTIGDDRHESTGVGYHDHNWGNVGLMEIVHDWYWARGQAGPYSVIASYITAHEKYGYAPIPVFMLARDGVLIGERAAGSPAAQAPLVDAVPGARPGRGPSRRRACRRERKPNHRERPANVEQISPRGAVEPQSLSPSPTPCSSSGIALIGRVRTVERTTVMQYTQLGERGPRVSRIAFGNWSAGGDWGQVDRDAAIAATREALHLGVTLFDTAHAYGFGAAEALLGDALAPEIRSARESIFLATKGGLRKEDGNPVRDSSPRVCAATSKQASRPWTPTTSTFIRSTGRTRPRRSRPRPRRSTRSSMKASFASSACRTTAPER
jgi:hypothetical protein